MGAGSVGDKNALSKNERDAPTIGLGDLEKIFLANHLGIPKKDACTLLKNADFGLVRSILGCITEEKNKDAFLLHENSFLDCIEPATLRNSVFDAVQKASAQNIKNAKNELEECNMEKISISSFGDFDYPSQLLSLSDAPPIIYYKGNLACLLGKTAAIVGTRSPNEKSMRLAYNYARELASKGTVVVSGLAEGIDTSAHLGAIANRSPTVGVLGTGLSESVMFPKSNLAMSREMILCQGALISELPPKTKGQKWTFPRRDRIIAALSDCVIAVEASLSSGTMITVNKAKELGVKVFSPKTKIMGVDNSGIEGIIKNGTATAISNSEDVIKFLAGYERKLAQDKIILKKDEKKFVDITETERTPTVQETNKWKSKPKRRKTELKTKKKTRKYPAAQDKIVPLDKFV